MTSLCSESEIWQHCIPVEFLSVRSLISQHVAETCAHWAGEMLHGKGAGKRVADKNQTRGPSLFLSWVLFGNIVEFMFFVVLPFIPTIKRFISAALLLTYTRIFFVLLCVVVQKRTFSLCIDSDSLVCSNSTLEELLLIEWNFSSGKRANSWKTGKTTELLSFYDIIFKVIF